MKTAVVVIILVVSLECADIVDGILPPVPVIYPYPYPYGYPYYYPYRRPPRPQRRNSSPIIVQGANVVVVPQTRNRPRPLLI